MAQQDLHSVLDKYVSGLTLLSLESTPAEFENAVSYLAPNCTVYQMGSSVPVSSDRAGYIADFKKLLAFWEMLQRRVVLRATSADGKTIIHEMDNDLKIHGETLSHFKETLIAEFNDAGLISCIRVYCDPSPIKELISKHASGQ